VDLDVVLDEDERLPLGPQAAEQLPVGRGVLAQGDELGVRGIPLERVAGERVYSRVIRADDVHRTSGAISAG